jgi:hypothetical protein
MVVTGLPGHEAGESLTAAVHQVEPQVIGQRAVAVGAFGIAEEIANDRDVVGLHLTLDVEDPHGLTLPFDP